MESSNKLKKVIIYFIVAISSLNGFAQSSDNRILENNQSQVLPVILTSFNLKSNEPNKIIVNWSTSAEANNSHFRLYIAPKDSEHFVLIGKVNGAGNSSIQRDYQFVINDVNPKATAAFLPFILILLVPSVRNKILKIGILTVLAILVVSCSKEEMATTTEPKSFYVKLDQVDYDGKVTVLYARAITIDVPKK